MAALPAVTGPQLFRLLIKDGWTEKSRNSHVVSMFKKFPDRTRTTVVPLKNKPLPDGTRGAILGQKQTGLGRAGLERLIERHGLH